VGRDKTVRTRKAGIPVAPAPEPRLRLLRPDSECSTADHALGLSREVKEMLKGLRRKPADTNDDGPEAA
jgi:hypothetical protein